jgi:hypothetical protein
MAAEGKMKNQDTSTEHSSVEKQAIGLQAEVSSLRTQVLELSTCIEDVFRRLSKLESGEAATLEQAPSETPPLTGQRGPGPEGEKVAFTSPMEEPAKVGSPSGDSKASLSTDADQATGTGTARPTPTIEKLDNDRVKLTWRGQSLHKGETVFLENDTFILDPITPPSESDPIEAEFDLSVLKPQARIGVWSIVFKKLDGTETKKIEITVAPA